MAFSKLERPRSWYGSIAWFSWNKNNIRKRIKGKKQEQTNKQITSQPHLMAEHMERESTCLKTRDWAYSGVRARDSNKFR